MTSYTDWEHYEYYRSSHSHTFLDLVDDYARLKQAELQAQLERQINTFSWRHVPDQGLWIFLSSESDLIQYSQTIPHNDDKGNAVYRLIRLLVQPERDKHNHSRSSRNEFEKILHMTLMMSVSKAERAVFIQYLRNQERANTGVEE